MDSASVIMVLAALSGLYMAWSIGANDVANAMGTSVGSGALKVGHAIMIAMVFEFAGAFFAGGTVSQTVGGGIIHLGFFEENALLLAAGMTCCLLAASSWLHFASYLGIPVSTTQSIVGAVIGLGLVVGGPAAVDGQAIVTVGFAWVLSPLIAAWLGYLCLVWLARHVLGSGDPLTRIKRVGPVLVGVIVSSLVLGVIFRGNASLRLSLEFWTSVLIALPIGAVAAFVSMPVFRRLASRKPESLGDEVRMAERVFQLLQIITACYLAFAHGSNDVANAIGPLAAIFHALYDGISQTVDVSTSVLLVGAVGILLGLASYGYKVMATIGRGITALTPSAGFCAVFAAATVILIGTKLGLPVSTSHIMVGAVIGVGLARGVAAINLSLLRSIFVSWVVTVPVTASLAAGLAWGAQHLL